MADTAHLWLDLEPDGPAAQDFVARENTRTSAAFAGPAMDADVARIRAILENPDRIGGVIRRGPFLYTFRQLADHPRGLWLRLPEGEVPDASAPWQTVFDLDAYCAQTGEDWHWRGAVTAWFDPSRVLLRLSDGGSDQTRTIEFDCDTQSIVPGGFDIPAERGNADWIDADTLLWTTAIGEGAATHAGWARRVQRLGRDGAIDLVFEGAHTDVTASGYIWRDGTGARRTGIVQVHEIGKMTISLEQPDGSMAQLIAPRDAEPNHGASHFAYISKGSEQPAGTLLLGPIGGPATRPLFTPGPRRAVVEDSILFHKGWLLWTVQADLVPSLWALDLSGPDATPRQIALPEPADSLWVSPHDANPDGDAASGALQLSLSGFVLSPRSFLFDLSGGLDVLTFRPLKTQTPDFDATGMEVRLHLARSDDGTEIPYHIVLPKDAEMGALPVLQYGYGGFGVALSPHYDGVQGALWLAQGGAFVQAYIRGGGEFGPDWHEVAKGAGRSQGFADFAAVAADLVARGYTTPARICCHGGSNGGLLCGVMLTRYPAHFGAVWASVGVTDMLRFHNFPAGRAWIDEYGDPDVPREADWLRAYSPLHNVAPQAERPYPPALIDTGAHDDRVDPSHSRRFAAALSDAGQPHWFMAHTGGHGGGGGSDTRAREAALGYAFLRATIAA